MKENSIVFRLLTSEESGAVSGGSMPMFVMDSRNDSREGRIMNADGHGGEVNIYGSKNSKNMNQTDEPPYQELGLPVSFT